MLTMYSLHAREDSCENYVFIGLKILLMEH